MKPRGFIGSSKEGSDVLNNLNLSLAKDYETVPWDGSIFGLSQTTIESLEEALGNIEFAVFIVTADDLRHKRGEKGKIPRDNVVFELGLFIGRHGRKKTFIVCDPKTVELPSDFGGLTVATYDSKNKELENALRPAATRIQKAISKASAPIVSPEDRGNLVGIWDSTWTNEKDPKHVPHTEVVTITEQKGPNIYGEIVYPDDREKRWQLEGRFSDNRFLQLYYYPSPKATNKLVKDYGCYFFELEPEGKVLDGYSVGYCFEDKETAVSKHKMIRTQGKGSARRALSARTAGKPLASAAKRRARKAR